jgi:hypothetical protein
MKHIPSVLAVLLFMSSATLSADDSLGSHIHSTKDFGELRGMTAEWANGTFNLIAAPVAPVQTALRRPDLSWAVVPAPKRGWDLASKAAVEAEITNHSSQTTEVLFWVVGDHGWDAVLDTAKLAPNETRLFSCDLRSVFPDKTPKIDPTQIKQVQFMLTGKVAQPITLEVRNLKATGTAPSWQLPPSRLDVPPVEDSAPAPGKRVRYRLAGDEKSDIYSILNLPEDWKSGVSYPVIVEFPGNIFFAPVCYSTGLPEQCVIGYGITKGKGAICVGLPFVVRSTGTIAEDGWGNPDDTAAYAIQMVDEVCAKFGGDRENIVLTGFSRGAIACGYIGLRNDRIAALWKGFHACQHYDGAEWNGATMTGALERATRFQGKAVFQTDNPQEKFQPVMDTMKTHVTWAQSGLGFHATAMFFDDRSSTRQLRDWFWELVGKTSP